MNNKIIYLKDSNYKEIIKNYKNYFIIIDFFAEWCLPCKKMDPIFQKLSIENNFKNLLFCSVNIDNNSLLIEKYNIKSIPTFVLQFYFEIISVKTGVINFNELKEYIFSSITNFNKKLNY